MNSILYNGERRVENQTKTRVWEVSSLCPETSTKNAVQEFHLWWHWNVVTQKVILIVDQIKISAEGRCQSGR